jgi:ankyrin repeat protein
MHTALAAACHRGNEEVVQLLIDNGAEVNHTGADGRSAIFFAAGFIANGDPHDPHVDIEHGSVECAAALLKAGADVNHQDSGGWTASHSSAAAGQADLLRYFLNNGMRADISDEDGTLALHVAVATLGTLGDNEDEVDVLGCVESLLEAEGVDINARETSTGDSALHIAVALEVPSNKHKSKMKLVKLLLDEGAEIDTANKNGDTPLGLALNAGKSGVEAVELMRRGLS